MNEEINALYKIVGILINYSDDSTIKLYNPNFKYYQENYIQIKNLQTGIFVYEVQRDSEKIIINTDSMEEAFIYAIFAYKKLYDRLSDNNIVKKIRECISDGNENQILSYINQNWDKDFYSVNDEIISKISLIRHNDFFDIKFMGKYIVKDVSASRGYVVFYNYYVKLQNILQFCDLVKGLTGDIFSVKEALNIYFFNI